MTLFRPVSTGGLRPSAHFLGAGAGGTAETGSLVILIFGAGASEPWCPSWRCDFRTFSLSAMTLAPQVFGGVLGSLSTIFRRWLRFGFPTSRRRFSRFSRRTAFEASAAAVAAFDASAMATASKASMVSISFRLMRSPFDAATRQRTDRIRRFSPAPE
jgi:hypothetical protein